MTEQAAYTVRLEDALRSLYVAAKRLTDGTPWGDEDTETALRRARDVLPRVDGEAVSIFERLRRGETVG